MSRYISLVHSKSEEKEHHQSTLCFRWTCHMIHKNLRWYGIIKKKKQIERSSGWLTIQICEISKVTALLESLIHYDWEFESYPVSQNVTCWLVSQSLQSPAFTPKANLLPSSSGRIRGNSDDLLQVFYWEKRHLLSSLTSWLPKRQRMLPIEMKRKWEV